MGGNVFQLGDDVVTRRARELTFARRGVSHAHANLSGAPARVLRVTAPAGFEHDFDRIAARITGSEAPREAANPIPETVTVGPPPGE